ncbi:MAG: hypothetical protein KC503_11230 [Myxococcales bacterium]|nr:hypothetical protein [Myxococcales bacterium]
MKRSELLILVAMLAVAASYAVPRYLQYQRRGALVEATANLDRIARGAQTYFASSAKVAKEAPQLPPSAASWAPAPPLHERCAKGKARYDADANKAFDEGPWKQLGFTPKAPLALRYHWLVRRQATTLSPAEAAAYALGDLGCDGQLSRWRVVLRSEGGRLRKRGPELVAGAR